MKRIPGGGRTRAVCGFLAILTLFVTGQASAQEATDATTQGNGPAPSSTPNAANGSPAAHPSFLDRVSGLGFYPRVGGVSTRAVVGVGAGFRDEHLFGGSIGIDASAVVSSRRSRGYQVLFGLLSNQRGSIALAPADARPTSLFEEASDGAPAGFSLYGDFRYRSYAGRTYGEAADNAGQDRSDLLLDGASYDVVAQYQPKGVFGVTARAGVLDLARVTAGESSTIGELAAEPPGLSGRWRFLVFGVGAALDTRSSKSDPRDGVFAGLAAWRFNTRSGEASNFTRVTFDARSYWTPFGPRGVVAGRVLLSTDSTTAGGEVPFSLQQSLGGGETLRGFALDRFRDLSLAYVTAEYRFQLNRFLDIGPFVDVGAVGPSLARLSLGNWRSTYGARAGLHYHSRVLLHLDLGRSPAGYRLTAGSGVLF